VPGRAAAALGVYLQDVRPRLVRDPREGTLFLTAWWSKRLSDEILGHNKLETTGLYARVVIEDLRLVVPCAPAGEGLPAPGAAVQ
jgi:site-specific recombinase XerD